ncbi:hypothetical protein [Halosegnis sp.]|uniref:hypothetical protein n=1 Tax=Halosegnis sp. TaxID=2864959 RepID=UPI0035D43D0E
MYALPFRVVLAGLGVGLSYVFVGAACYLLGRRRESPRIARFGRALVEHSPAVILGAAATFLLLVAGGGRTALAVVALAALVPPVRALLLARAAETS